MNGDAQRPMNLPPIPVGAAGSVRLSSGLYVPVPFRLYKYAAPDLGRIQDVLVDGKVYFAPPSTFNDPADCLTAPDFSDPAKSVKNNPALVQYAIDKGMAKSEQDVIDILARRIAITGGHVSYDRCDDGRRELNIGVFCLCERRDDVRMWAHYAANHYGISYAFDFSGYSKNKEGNFFPFEFLFRVEYVEQKRLLKPKFEIDSDLFHFIRDKSKDWEYEREWRVVMWDDKAIFKKSHDALSHKRRGAGVYEMPDDVLRGIILGFRMDESLKEKIAQMANNRRIGIWEIKPESMKYGLSVKPLNDFAKEDDMKRNGKN